MWKIRQAAFVSPSRFTVEIKKEKKIMTITKLFALDTNAKRCCVNAFAALIFDLTSPGFILLNIKTVKKLHHTNRLFLFRRIFVLN